MTHSAKLINGQTVSDSTQLQSSNNSRFKLTQVERQTSISDLLARDKQLSGLPQSKQLRRKIPPPIFGRTARIIRHGTWNTGRSGMGTRHG